MHVAYIHQHFSTRKGSTGTRSYELSQRLIKAGHKVTLICGTYAGSDATVDGDARVVESDIDGIRVLRVAEPYSNQMGFARRVLAFWRFAQTAQRLVVESKADLVFATSTPLTVGIPGMKGAKRLGVPFVFEVRDLWPELPITMGIVKNPVLKWYLRRLERKIYNAAAWINALSPGMKEGICRAGYSADRVSVIPNASDLDVFHPSTEPLTDERFGSADEFRLVFTGAHGLANGLDAVLDAVAEIKRRGERGVRFVFIGDGKLKPHLMERARQEGLDPWVSWASPVSKNELAEILPRFDVGMMILKDVPAFYYGTSPNKFFDYIASGLPVLNNYPGWLADMIAEHKCGTAVPPGDPVAFADAVLHMRDNRDQLPEMGRNARALAEARFSREELGRQFVDVIERVYAEHGKNR
ncbi:MAG: glycosyltransferase family 4 protein [Phycisphaerae bacterium]|nr:glycosyltransferase family 4 protein [Phycisphaerae bacterium]